MLRFTNLCRPPVFCLIIDQNRLEQQQDLARRGVGFNTKVELGFAVQEMEIRHFQQLLDQHFKKVSPDFHTVTMGQVLDEHFQKVAFVRAGRKYVITGQMKNGYIKADPKYGSHRLNGQTGNYKGGLQWGGERW